MSWRRLAAVSCLLVGACAAPEGEHRPELRCDRLRSVGLAGIEATIRAPVIEKDSCWEAGGRAVYEAFVKSPGAEGRPAHFKFTFKGRTAGSGIVEICSDARTGLWECVDV